MSTRSSAVASPRGRALAVYIAKPLMFTVLIWLSAAAGEVPIPGTPVPITLQTFMVMFASLMLDWRQAAGSVALYLAAGAAGLPVFAGGTSTAALFGPSAGFLIGFLPGAIVTALLKGQGAKRDDGSRKGLAGTLLTAARYFGASLAGGVAVVYAFGFVMQSMLTHTPITVVAVASMGFVIGDIIKASIAAAAAAGLSRL